MSNVRQFRPIREVPNLDRLWELVNALGGTVEDGDEFGRGCNETVAIVLDFIEKMGGCDPNIRACGPHYTPGAIPW